MPVRLSPHTRRKPKALSAPSHANNVGTRADYTSKPSQLFMKRRPKKLEAAASAMANPERFSIRTGLEDAFSKAFRAYSRALEEKPLVTKSATAGVISLVGNILGQFLVSRLAGNTFMINRGQLTAFTLTGFLFVGPYYVHAWYEQLWKVGKWLKRERGSSKTVRTLSQVTIDQTIGVAIFFPLYFLIYEFIEAMVTMRVPQFTATTQKIRNELLSIILVNYKVWPLANLFSFSYVPRNLRALFSNVISVFWNAYLCTRLVPV